ncbi:hypothetical protein LCGC14_2076270 [marine sediment metagenome]|uniref:Uncharacterized protein n=1 Tax=marine sediment metagenome TaxID=412755 RepID=A0A0F9EH68_9ZZZZ
MKSNIFTEKTLDFLLYDIFSIGISRLDITFNDSTFQITSFLFIIFFLILYIKQFRFYKFLPINES